MCKFCAVSRFGYSSPSPFFFFSKRTTKMLWKKKTISTLCKSWGRFSSLWKTNLSYNTFLAQQILCPLTYSPLWPFSHPPPPPAPQTTEEIHRRFSSPCGELTDSHTALNTLLLLSQGINFFTKPRSAKNLSKHSMTSYGKSGSAQCTKWLVAKTILLLCSRRHMNVHLN